MEKYLEFLKNKMVLAPDSGIEVSESEINPILLPHQRDAVVWALKGGRRALFESFGLGKTIQQLEIIRVITQKEGGRGLIICPLGVRQEFKKDAERLLKIPIKYVRSMEEVEASSETVLITNYERVRDGNIDPRYFKVTSLDEASVLRSYGSKTYQTFLDKFQGIPYKFVCTATPSPNKYKELIHYAGYLEVMDTGQALTRFFQRDSTQANNLTIYPHKENEFWLWMSSWALFLTKPSDLGYSDEGYEMPEMKIHYHEVNVDHLSAGVDRDGQSLMFREAAMGLKDAAREKRDSLPARVHEMEKIVAESPEDHFIVWHDLEAERHAVMKSLPKNLYNSAEAYGSQDLDKREQTIVDFSEGKIKYLATKPAISGQGCNFQYHCHKAIFLGIGYGFNDFIQAIHRIYRYQQKYQVEVHVIYAESEGEILKALLRKWKQHEKLVKEMTDIIKKHGLSSTNLENKMLRSMGVTRKIEKGKLFEAVHNDCTIETKEMESNSVGLVVTSIPFANHYEYTPSYNDYGHTNNNDHFFEQMDFLTPEILRVLKPGRIAAIHVKDRILFGNATGMGMPTVSPFHAETIFHYMKHGFAYMGMISIETDVVRENNQTYRLGWSEQCKDGSKMGVGSPEYLLLFRKLPSDTSKAYADEKVSKSKDEYTRGQWQIDARAKWNSSGNRFLSPEEIKQMPLESINNWYKWFVSTMIYDYDTHVNLAKEMDRQGKLPATFETLRVPARSPWVWHDVNRMRTLNGDQTRRKLQMHVCPLQFDIVDRSITRYSNEGDLVYDPFGGLMTVPVRAMKLGRKGKACELNPDYFRDGVGYCRATEMDVTSPTLFETLEVETN